MITVYDSKYCTRMLLCSEVYQFQQIISITHISFLMNDAKQPASDGDLKNLAELQNSNAQLH